MFIAVVVTVEHRRVCEGLVALMPTVRCQHPAERPPARCLGAIQGLQTGPEAPGVVMADTRNSKALSYVPVTAKQSGDDVTKQWVSPNPLSSLK